MVGGCCCYGKWLALVVQEMVACTDVEICVYIHLRVSIMALFTFALNLMVKETRQRLLTMVKERDQWDKEVVHRRQRVLILQHDAQRGMRNRWSKFWYGRSRAKQAMQYTAASRSGVFESKRRGKRPNIAEPQGRRAINMIK
jgi:hypothetical protein